MAAGIQNSARVQGAPAPEPLALGLAHQVPGRVHFWRGASGRRYVHAVYSLFECPPLPRATYILAHRDETGRRTVLHVGHCSSDAPTLNLAQVPPARRRPRHQRSSRAFPGNRQQAARPRPVRFARGSIRRARARSLRTRVAHSVAPSIRDYLSLSDSAECVLGSRVVRQAHHGGSRGGRMVLRSPVPQLNIVLSLSKGD